MGDKHDDAAKHVLTLAKAVAKSIKDKETAEKIWKASKGK